MLNDTETVLVPAHLAELAEWFLSTVGELEAKNGWSVTLNGNSGTVETDVRQSMPRMVIDGCERRIEVRDFRQFRLRRKK